MRRYRFGELPESLSRERQPGRVLDPAAGLALDWKNRYQTLQFGTLVGLASNDVLQDNELRTYLYIGNKSATADVFVGFGRQADAFSGALILPRGFAELIGGEDGGAFCPSDSVNLISTAANTNVTIIEGTLKPYSIDEFYGG